MDWVKIELRLPVNQDYKDICNDSVLIYGKYGVQKAIYMNGESHCGYASVYRIENITHWCEIIRPK